MATSYVEWIPRTCVSAFGRSSGVFNPCSLSGFPVQVARALFVIEDDLCEAMLHQLRRVKSLNIQYRRSPLQLESNTNESRFAIHCVTNLYCVRNIGINSSAFRRPNGGRPSRCVKPIGLHLNTLNINLLWQGFGKPRIRRDHRERIRFHHGIPHIVVVSVFRTVVSYLHDSATPLRSKA